MALASTSRVSCYRRNCVAPELLASVPGEMASNKLSLLVEQYHTVRRVTERICEPLATEDYVVQSMPDASPVKWHLAHTSWFFETFLLVPHLPGYEPFHPQFGVLFNSYYDAVGLRWPRARRGHLSRPTVADVYTYRAHVDQAMDRLLEREPQDLPADFLLKLLLGLNHEQQHQELILTDVKHVLACNLLRPVYQAGLASEGSSPAAKWLTFPAGLATIGHEGGAFAFDNESPRHRVYLQQFRLANRLVTSGEYLAFLQDGGYERPEWWLSDGWSTRTAQEWTCPLYWEQEGEEWQIMTLGGPRPLDPAEPVCHVSFYEANAYARWAGARLPTEAEWETAASTASMAGHFLESGYFHPAAALSRDDRGPLFQLYGAVWQWTASPYVGYPGYTPPAGALGEYNGKFMCNQLVLRGASCVTPRSHARRSYRNFFPPDARWQFSGIRLAQDVR
jgi:ergothioneine biosynthesis protein EgtB